MGSCVKKQNAPQPCDLIVYSTISETAKLTSKPYSGIHDSYEFIKYLGHGQYGTVREAIPKNQPSPHSFAIKSIVKQNLFKHRQVMRREIEIMKLTDHPNIVKLYETYEDQMYLHLVMEYCAGGDVFDRIIEKGSFSENEAAILMKQLLSAVNYLHLHNITHRDLKPENFLYESLSSDTIKICDFGMSIKNENFSKLKSMAGTPYYLAPEVLKGNYTKACDIWSMGVFMHFMLTGKVPFRGSDAESVYAKAAVGMEHLELEGLTVSEKAKDLLKSMLTVKESRRITAKKALQHSWFQELTNTVSIPYSVFNSLRKYRAKNKLWQDTMKLAVRNLSSKEINNLRDAFIQLDTENSGSITANDLFKVMNANGMHLITEDIQNIVRNVSSIEKGKINYTDFLIATIGKKETFTNHLLWEAFKQFDSGSGKLNQVNLRNGLNAAGCELDDEEYKDLLAETKFDENSAIDFEAFKKIVACFEEEHVKREVGSEKITIIRKFSKNFNVQWMRYNSAV